MPRAETWKCSSAISPSLPPSLPPLLLPPAIIPFNRRRTRRDNPRRMNARVRVIGLPRSFAAAFPRDLMRIFRPAANAAVNTLTSSADSAPAEIRAWETRVIQRRLFSKLGRGILARGMRFHPPPPPPTSQNLSRTAPRQERQKTRDRGIDIGELAAKLESARGEIDKPATAKRNKFENADLNFPSFRVDRRRDGISGSGV
jgi:hypothetical protein